MELKSHLRDLQRKGSGRPRSANRINCSGETLCKLRRVAGTVSRGPRVGETKLLKAPDSFTVSRDVAPWDRLMNPPLVSISEFQGYPTR